MSLWRRKKIDLGGMRFKNAPQNLRFPSGVSLNLVNCVGSAIITPEVDAFDIGLFFGRQTRCELGTSPYPAFRILRLPFRVLWFCSGHVLFMAEQRRDRDLILFRNISKRNL